MLVLSQTASNGAISSSNNNWSSKISISSTLKSTRPSPPTIHFSKLNKKSPRLSTAKAADNNSAVTKQPSPQDDTVFVGQDDVPLEGVIQFDKSSLSSRVQKWGRIALLAGGDVLALLLFAAIGRFGHGFPVFDVETLRTADPFIAGWFLSAYFLGGYAEDGRGMNGSSKAIFAAAKSWALGVPMGLGIRALTSGHLPPANFILVSLGSTAVLLIGYRALLVQILPSNRDKKDDTYRSGSPFELFELLTSLVRRW